MNSLQRIGTAARWLGTRQMCTKNLQAQIKAKQEFFQVPNGLMVHEKTAFDRTLFFITAVGTAIATGMSLKFYYDFSFPKKA